MWLSAGAGDFRGGNVFKLGDSDQQYRAGYIFFREEEERMEEVQAATVLYPTATVIVLYGTMEAGAHHLSCSFVVPTVHGSIWSPSSLHPWFRIEIWHSKRRRILN